jgi:hypothetical protein
LTPESQGPAVPTESADTSVGHNSGVAVDTEANKTAGQDAGREHYDSFLKETLDDALARKSTLEQRGINVVTTAGALLTIVFSVVSFVIAHVGSHAINPHSIIQAYIDAAALLFVTAALLGLIVNIPVPYGDPDPRDLRGLLVPTKSPVLSDQNVGEVAPSEGVLAAETAATQVAEPVDDRLLNATPSQDDVARSSRFLTDSADVAMWDIAVTRVKLLRRARTMNQLKARLLFVAVLSEVAAVAMLAWGVHRLLGL